VHTTRGKPQLLTEDMPVHYLLPFHVTAQAWPLGRIDGLICQDGLHGCPQIFSRQRILIAWPTRVELSAIDEFALLVELEKVRGARSGIGLG
jgi:hypothetical protein